MNKMKIAKKLIKLRGEKAKDEVAKSLGISVSAIQMYEKGERVPKDEIKIRIAKFYQKTVQEIFFD